MPTISVLAGDRCGARVRWKRQRMPRTGKVWHGICGRCGDIQSWTVRPARIAAADLRYVRTIAPEDDDVVDVTDLTELVQD